MGERKGFDPNYKKGAIARFLEQGTPEYSEALSDPKVKAITEQMAGFYLVKAALPGCQSELLCVGHHFYDDRRREANCYLYSLPNPENRPFIREAYLRRIQKQVSARAAKDFRAADVVIVQSGKAEGVGCGN